MAEITFTGERFLPGCVGEISYEHWHRYAFARRFVAGKRVLDAAFGEGDGTSTLGEAAASVIGVDIDGASVAHATARYGEGAACNSSRQLVPTCRCPTRPLTSLSHSRPSSTWPPSTSHE
jgi:2-polyprenyl-3-methyl-5-hydroxy-6-metoxy-1,4-benzoquinol methylase